MRIATRTLSSAVLTSSAALLPSYRGRAVEAVQPLSLSSPARRTAHPGRAAAAGDCFQPG